MPNSLASTAFLVATWVIATTVAPFAQSTLTAPFPTPQPIAEGFGAGAYLPQPGITDPVDVKTVEGKYPSEAMRAKIQGGVLLEVVVQADGTVGDVRVVRSLDKALDESAIKAVKQWLFRPALLNGKPVPVVVRVSHEFRLHGSSEPIRRTWIPDDEFLWGVSWLGQPGVTMPVLERSVEPKYTAAALSAKITGTVTVDMVVGQDGSVFRARIARGIDQVDGTKRPVPEARRWFSAGLDLAALEAASEWRFKPGLVNGQPANVLVTVTMEFRLH